LLEMLSPKPLMCKDFSLANPIHFLALNSAYSLVYFLSAPESTFF
jgi:hypothetical protein